MFFNYECIFERFLILFGPHPQIPLSEAEKFKITSEYRFIFIFGHFPLLNDTGMKHKLIIEPKGNECIETVAKRRYWSAVDGYMKSRAENIEVEIEMLKKFLEEMDVSKYRSEMEELAAQGKKVSLVLKMDDDGRISAETKEEK